MPSGYADFHLLINRSDLLRNSGRYRGRVISSPVGQAAVDFDLPFNPEEIKHLSWRTGSGARQLALTASLASQSARLTPQEFGARLFEALFAGSVGAAFLRSLDEAERSDTILRVRLQFDDVPEVAELPWEFLYSRDLGRFLVLSTRTPLVRYLGVAQGERPLAVPLPLRLLVIVSNPSDLPRLAVEEEWARLNQALDDLVEQGKLIVERLERATLATLRQWLRRQEVNLLHFIGHGSFDLPRNEGSLVFENEAQQAAQVNSAQLATVLGDHAALRLVFLNACQGASGGSQESFAGVAQKLVQQGVPALLAMQFAVSDRSAIALAHEFYLALSDGLPIESAVSEARKAIYSEGEAFEWGTPVLFSRSPDGVILQPQRESMSMAKDNTGNPPAKAWWEQLVEDQDPTGIGAVDTSGVTGDVIIGIVGAGASDVAVGKNITQRIYNLVGAPTPDDMELIAQKFAEIEAVLAAQKGSLDAGKVQTAEGYLQLLRGELMKTGEAEIPSASTITLVGNWLLDNVPPILEALTSLFATPAVGRVVGKAGEVAASWVKQRFS